MYTKIMVAVDSSDTAKKALDEAIRLAGAFATSLCIVHALDEGPLAQHGLGIGTFLDIDQVKAEMRKAAEQLLEGAAATAAAAGLSAERRLLESEDLRIAEQLAGAARDWGADLIVVGTHGRHGVDRLLVGSVAENLMRLAGTSLLMVR